MLTVAVCPHALRLRAAGRQGGRRILFLWMVILSVKYRKVYTVLKKSVENKSIIASLRYLLLNLSFRISILPIFEYDNHYTEESMVLIVDGNSLSSAHVPMTV